jgi:DNA-binding protein HU-beta
MNKAELALVIHEKIGITKADAERTLDMITRTITEKLVAGEEVTLSGFGAFSSKKRKGRIGVNPRNTKEAINIPSVTVAKFKPGKNLKDVLKGRTKFLHAEPEITEEAPAPAKPEDDMPEAAEQS